MDETPTTRRVPSEGLVLRDGSTASVRPATPSDLEAVQVFLAEFGTARPAVDEARDVRALVAAHDPREQTTLVVTRRSDGAPRVVGLGTYARREDEVAAISLAVSADWRGLGVATRLLERLAGLAAHHGFRTFHAEVDPDDRATLETFRRSGLLRAVGSAEDRLTVDLTVIPDAAGRARAAMRDRLYTTLSLLPFFRPSAVAVVGAGRDPKNLGHRVLDALIANRFRGPVFVVNPFRKVVGSFRTHASLSDLPESVDLAIVAVPKHAVLDVVADAAQAGVRALVVITAGFAETGAEGRALQAKVLDAVRGHGMRMVGPNCMGLIDTNPDVSLAATFAPIFPPHGRVAMLSQSGALGVAILQFARDLNLGLSTFVSVGNKADVSGNDLLQYWEEDPDTDVILLYLESFGNPRRFSRIARRVSRHKPIVVVKGGRSGAGRRAADSHTASLAGSDAASDALFRQTGMLRADTLEEMFHVALLLSSQPLPSGPRVAVLTNAGGPAILVADALEQNGLRVEPLPDSVQAELRTFLPDEASVTNPVDMIASAGPAAYRQAAEKLLASDDLDAVIVIDVPLDEAQWDAIQPELRAGIEAGQARATRPKPVLACVMGAGGSAQPVHLEGDIPCFPFPEAAARALARVTQYAQWRRTPVETWPTFPDVDMARARARCRAVLEARGESWLSADETRDVLLAAGLPVLPGGVAKTPHEACALAEKVGYPVAAKLASTTIVHKTEMNGVHLGLSSAEEVSGAFEAVRARLAAEGREDELEGVLIQPMVRRGCELLIGVTEDPVFGSLVAFGLGGIHVEVLRDVQFRVAPLSTTDADEMIQGIRGRKLLDGYRGHPPADLDALRDALLRVSHLVEEVPEIHELDLNPLIALEPGAGCRIVDARILVRP